MGIFVCMFKLFNRCRSTLDSIGPNCANGEMCIWWGGNAAALFWHSHTVFILFFFYLQTLPIYQMILYTYKNNAHKQLDVTCKNCVGNDQLFSIILSAYFDSRKNWWQSHANIKLFIMIWKFVRRQQRMSLWLVYWKNRMKSPTTKQKHGYIYNSMHIPVFRQQHKFQSATGIFWINLKQQSMWCGINVVINTCTYWHATVNMESFVSHWQTRLLWLLL